MAKKDYSLVTVIVIALVVAVIVSVITANITGNVIKVKRDPTGPQVYTKAEIDNMFSNINASSCNADNVCEVNMISSPRQPLLLNGSRFVTLLTNLSTSDVTINGRLMLWNGRLGLERPLNPNRTYYLCIAEDSNVYRSITPCV